MFLLNVSFKEKLLRMLLLNTFKTELVGFYAANRPHYVIEVHFNKRLKIIIERCVNANNTTN